ncbi:hypothetical protein EV589_4789 [Mycobacterium sp. BK558]|nr:hypothetical protein EV589_4789 [Mycobacterium sp. BK558]
MGSSALTDVEQLERPRAAIIARVPRVQLLCWQPSWHESRF